ncbi:TIGR02300 family protein [Oricola indica]|uniref:TIGR02300 family protein n=1 Tax=Oricola indica TaxID=2872591 RepID=UPI001CC1088C
MAKPELGTKRICPETGRKFYDLNKDPIVSPYTGKTYPLSYFEDTKSEIIEEKAEEAEETKAEPADEEEDTGTAEVISLEDAEEDESGKDDNLPDLGDNTDDDDLDIDDDDDDDTFLAEDEDDDDDDVSDIIDVAGGDDDES